MTVISQDDYLAMCRPWSQVNYELSMMNSISCVSYTQEIRTFYASKSKSRTVLDKAFILKSSFASFVFFLTFKFHVTRLAVIEK